MRFRPTPKQRFVIVSLLLIMAIAVATSISQAVFFRQAIIERESRLIGEVVDAVAVGAYAVPPDMQNFKDELVQREIARRFSLLKNLPGVVRIKVFNLERRIAWSDDPGMIGTKLTRHPEYLQDAMKGEIRTAFSQIEQIVYAVGQIPPEPLIEFYVPFSWTSVDNANSPVDGVVALYRSPKELNVTIFHGLLFLWLVAGIGSAILLAAIFTLYRSVYNRQREVESQFAEFTKEQERIIQVEKLSAIGQMVTEIAHQLNNPLVGVINLAELAEREVDNPERLRELLRDVQNAGKHCRDFVQRMLRLNAAGRSEPKSADMADLVRETVIFFKQSFGKTPEIELEMPTDPVVLDVDPVLLRHALFNLLHNAALADPNGYVTVSLALAERAGVPGCIVAVSDRGEGIKPEVARKLFTPFFTTRTGGTGLGLLVAQQIVVKHGGNIRAENRAGGGARFAIWLPIQPRKWKTQAELAPADGAG